MRSYIADTTDVKGSQKSTIIHINSYKLPKWDEQIYNLRKSTIRGDEKKETS